MEGFFDVKPSSIDDDVDLMPRLPASPHAIAMQELFESNPVIKGRANLDRIRSFVDQKLQKYIDHPPGVGKSVMYVAVNIKDGKAYVGKHGHCDKGKSFAASRKKDHENPPDDRDTYFADAMRKYGPVSFEWYILWHGDASYEDDMEIFLISPAGVHTRLRADNGWGYNLRVGGEGGQHSPESIERMKKTKSTAEYKAAQSMRSKEMMDRQIAAGVPTCTDRILEYFANETDEQKTERFRKSKETRSTTEYVAAASTRGKAQWEREEEADPGERSRRTKAQMEREAAAWMKSLADRGHEYRANATEEQKDERIQKQKATQSTAEYVDAASARAKAQMEREAASGMTSLADRGREYRENETDEQKTERLRKLKASHTDEYIAASSARAKAQVEREEEADPGVHSRRAKAQAEREKAAGMKSLADRGREWLKNATPEQLAAVRQKQHDTHMAKRAEKLAKMTPAEQESQKLKNAREDRKSAKKKADLEQLQKLPGHENDNERDLPAARKAGLILPTPVVVLTPVQGERHAKLQKIIGYKLLKEQFANWVPPEERAKESDAPSSPIPVASSSIASSSTDPIASSTTAQKRKADPWLEASDDED